MICLISQSNHENNVIKEKFNSWINQSIYFTNSEKTLTKKFLFPLLLPLSLSLSISHAKARRGGHGKTMCADTRPWDYTVSTGTSRTQRRWQTQAETTTMIQAHRFSSFAFFCHSTLSFKAKVWTEPPVSIVATGGISMTRVAYKECERCICTSVRSHGCRSCICRLRLYLVWETSTLTSYRWRFVVVDNEVERPSYDAVANLGWGDGS